MSVTAVWVPVESAEVGGETTYRAAVDWSTLRSVHQDEQFCEYADGRVMQFAQIMVDERDLAEGRPPNCVPENLVPDEDRLCLAMTRAIRRNAYFVKPGDPVPREAARGDWLAKDVGIGRVFYRPHPAENVRLIEEAEITEKTADELANDPDARAARFFDSIPNVASATRDRKQMVVRLLEHAFRLGLSAEKEAHIAKQLNLTEVELHDMKEIAQ